MNLISAIPGRNISPLITSQAGRKGRTGRYLSLRIPCPGDQLAVLKRRISKSADPEGWLIKEQWAKWRSF